MSPEETAPSSEIVLRQPDARPVAAMPEPDPQPVAHVGACGKLSAALAMARDQCKSASKDKRNEFHKYAYASADEVILTAKEALANTGLAIIPQVQELTVLGVGNAAIYALNRTIFLSHSSGEFVPLSVRGWPVVPEKGRPLDKAFAVALTTSLSYLLRDLLQMPRGDDHDMNHRDDRKAEPAPTPAPSAKPAEVPKTYPQTHPAILRNEFARLVREVAQARAIEPDTVFDRTRQVGLERFHDIGRTTSDWTREQLEWGIDSLRKTLAKSQPAQREPGQDEDDGVNEPPHMARA